MRFRKQAAILTTQHKEMTMATHPNLKKHREQQKKLGRFRREYTATAAEHDELSATLNRLRNTDRDQPPALPAD